MKTYRELQEQVHETAKSHGWHESDELDADGFPTARQLGCWLWLVQDELDEAELETENFYMGENGKPEGAVIEYADAVIRILDIAGACGLNVGERIDYINNGTTSVLFDCIYTTRNELANAIRSPRRDDTALGHIAYLLAVYAWELMLQALDRGYIPDHIDSQGFAGEFLSYCVIKDEYNRKRPARHGGKLA